ncbi:MAG TPA: BamA/TamA family outer membrane protein, partial [Haliangium sp.]|nr:BamA/TamA family outer membrane protein [Haliangium sp.]
MMFPVNTQARRLVARPWPLVAILALVGAPPAAAQEGEGEAPEQAAEAAEPLGEPAAVEPVAAPEPEPAAASAPAPEPEPAVEPAAAGADDKDPNRLEFGVLPALNYDSDTGFGFGVIGTLVRFAPDYRPYRWRIKYLLYATLKSSPDGGTELAYHDDYVILDRPGLMQNRLRVQLQAGFRRASTAAYYGLGNASEDTENANGRFYQYDRIYPYGLASGRFQLWDRSTPEHVRRLEAFAGLGFWYNVMNLYEGSLLEANAQLAEQDTPDGRALGALLHGTEDHMLMMPSVGLLWDTRDNEHTPTRGNFTELSLRTSPGLQADLYFVGASVITRWFQSISGDTLVLAVRGIGDALLGNPPFYELATVGSFTRTDAPGGGSSVRGVAGQRFHGKLKVVGNVELRAQLLPFRVAGQRFNLGAIAFVDVGRVWADYGDVEIAGESLDDGLANFAMGMGAGLRLKWGETFIV